MFKLSELSQIWKKYIQKLNDWDLPLIDTRLLWLWKFFVNLGIATSFYRCPPLFPVELAIYYERLAERVVVFFLSIISQRIN